jgi:hypothetical protein
VISLVLSVAAAAAAVAAAVAGCKCHTEHSVMVQRLPVICSSYDKYVYACDLALSVKHLLHEMSAGAWPVAPGTVEGTHIVLECHLHQVLLVRPGFQPTLLGILFCWFRCWLRIWCLHAVASTSNSKSNSLGTSRSHLLLHHSQL